MNDENGFDSLADAVSAGRRVDLSLDDCAEEAHFRIGALLRAYANPAPDSRSIVKRAVALRTCLDDFSFHLSVLIKSQKK